jgi:hypothetical protein
VTRRVVTGALTDATQAGPAEVASTKPKEACMYLHPDFVRAVVKDRERELIQTVAADRLAAAASRTRRSTWLRRGRSA